jgi:hypothetical protein
MIAFLFLLKNKFDEGIYSGSIGVRSSILITSEPGNSELVARGVNDGMGEISAVDPSGFVTFFTGVSVFGHNRGKVCPCFIKVSNNANNFGSFLPGMDNYFIFRQCICILFHFLSFVFRKAMLLGLC